MRIAILDDYTRAVAPLPCMERLAGHELTIVHEPIAPGRVPQAVAQAEVIFPLRERTAFSDALLQDLPALRLISQSGPIPHIDLASCTRRGIVVSSGAAAGGATLAAGSRATAELAWGLVLAASRHIPAQGDALRAGRWQTVTGRMVHGLTLGILGYGQIGAQVAAYGKAFGMQVIATGRAASAERARGDGHEVVTREALFERSDVLSVHLRLSPETRGAITVADLARMKPDALFVNTARAELVAPGALAAALAAGRPGQAALDVFEGEPLWDAGDPLLRMPQVVATPHLGYSVREAYEAFYARAITQMEAFARGEPVDVRNPEVLG